MIKHPTDATQWWNIELWYPKFAIDPRNISITMSTDGMNPFINNNTYSTSPIVLTILSLPPWLYNKRKYIMMLGLILGPQQSGNDIDTYFRPSIENLKVMWYNDGVQVWDENKHEYIQLKAILFVTVSDSPVARNLLWQTK
jgi:hypothetical protein